jgi:spore coat polysaccharide biosynthesis predicted glycosyltransferase SpsG
MAALMLRADLAVTAGGITLFELACLGTPAIVVCGERFEMETAERMHEAGAALHAGFGGDLEPARLSSALDSLAGDFELRKRMSARGREMVDGQGAHRVMALIRENIQVRVS